MGMEADTQRCRVYAADGQLQATWTRALERHPLPRTRTIADTIPVTEIMARDVVCARPDLSVPALTELLVTNHIGCIPILDDRAQPVGIVTKLDIVDRS